MVAEEGADEWTVARPNLERVRAPSGEPMQAQKPRPQVVIEHVPANHARTRISASNGSLPTFVVGDYAMGVTVHKCGESPKFARTWKNPWRVVPVDEQHVHGVGNILTG